MLEYALLGAETLSMVLALPRSPSPPWPVPRGDLLDGEGVRRVLLSVTVTALAPPLPMALFEDVLGASDNVDVDGDGDDIDTDSDDDDEAGADTKVVEGEEGLKVNDRDAVKAPPPLGLVAALGVAAAAASSAS